MPVRRQERLATLTGVPGRAFLIALLLTLAVALLQGDKRFYFDSGSYWYLSDSFLRNGFSPLNFAEPLRGYAFPLLLLALDRLDDVVDVTDPTAVKALNSLSFASIACVLTPKLAELTWPDRPWGLWRRLLLALLLLALWRGYLDYPLTDFPSLALALVAIVASSRSSSPGWMAVAGLAAGLAVNLRPAYVPVLAATVALVLLSWREERGRVHVSRSRRVLCAALLILGFAAASLPQSLLAHRHHDTWSFMPGATLDLGRLQLTTGLKMQRYDTYVDGRAPYVGLSRPQMVWRDPSGERLLAEAGGEIDSRGEYLALLARRPLRMAAVLARHAINGLDQRFGSPYVDASELRSNRPARALGFALVFVALLRLAWPRLRRRLGPASARYLVALLACGLPAVASAVEQRFMLPVLLACCAVVLAPGWRRTAAEPGGRARALPALAATGVALAAYVAVVAHVTDRAADSVQFERPHAGHEAAGAR